jgi:pimeloyl-ACP methyl ester carboxylesterase
MRENSGQINLFYHHCGSGEPLLLLHGNGEDHHIFDCLSPLLARDFAVYAIDSRNHGQSDSSPEYSYQSMCQDMVSLICRLDLAPVHIVGFSDGAIIALYLAQQQPQLIRKMALLGANLRPADFKPEQYRQIVREYSQDPSPLLQLMLTEPDIALSQLRSINIPSLIIAGENDVFRPQLYPEMAQALPDSRLLIMPGHDHSSYLENSDLLYPHLYDFFKSGKGRSLCRCQTSKMSCQADGE